MKTHRFPVLDVARETPRAIVLTLDAAGSRLRFTVGQAALVGLADQRTRKPYSIATAPEEVIRDGSIRFLVEVGPDGEARPNLDGAAPGRVVTVDGPLGGFTLPRKLPRELLFIAGGTGIAPLRAMIASALSRPKPPSITLLYSARTPADFAFIREARRLARQGRLRLLVTATRESGPGWRGRRGRIRQAWVSALVRNRAPFCYVCGPEAFVARLIDMLRLARVPARRIRRERY